MTLALAGLITGIGELRALGVRNVARTGVPGAATATQSVENTGQRLVSFDYSASESAYVLPIDPLTRKGPMSIDSRLFTSGKSTANGGIRNQEQFWKMWEEKYPGTLSTENLKAIEKGDVPTVDCHWLKHFPEHQRYLKEKLEHHHIDQGSLATPLSEGLHRKNGNYSIWHE